MNQAVLGISAYYHDSAAALIVDGEICAAAQEERFTRKKHDPAFPENAVRYVLAEAGLSLSDLTGVAFYEKHLLKFERLLETYHAYAPRGLASFLSSMPVWVKEKIFMRKNLNDALAGIGPCGAPLYFPEHHLSHAASAFYPSPFAKAAILTVDGVGEWATTTIGLGEGRDISLLREISFPHSLGLLYSAFTYYCGFRVNSGEYKLMGLAPYGDPDSERTLGFVKKIKDELIDVREDGSYLLNMDYFSYATGLTMTDDARFEALFGVRRRVGESQLGQEHMDLALAIQLVTEEVVLKLARTARELTGCANLVLAGGVALNCVANGKLLRSGLFDGLWVQPAAGDAGGAVGAALAVHHITLGNERVPVPGDSMAGSYLGPDYTDRDVVRLSRRLDAPCTHFPDYQELCARVASLLDGGNVVGWFQGRMEYGPRALGNRSILGDARNPQMQKRLNLKIKYREGFRPFAPSVLAEDAGDYFDLDGISPYMLLVAPVRESRRMPLPLPGEKAELFDRLYHLRSDIPAVTHVDYSARVQTVHKETNERYWSLIGAFKALTGCPVIVNTSFNVRGEPVVCTPEDAYRCFMRTEMDYLVLGNHLFEKALQPAQGDDDGWKRVYELD